MEDITDFFLGNWDTVSTQVVWDAFKVFSQKIFIALKAHKSKIKAQHKDSLTQEIQVLTVLTGDDGGNIAITGGAN